MQELIKLLTRERLLIERLLYRVANMRNLMVGGQARFLAWAADEVADASDALAAVELTRATCYQALADRLSGLGDSFSWEALLEHANDTDAALLRGLRSDISTLASELKAHLAASQELSQSGLDSAAAVMAQLQGVDLSSSTHLAPSLDPRRHLDQTL